ncbi:Alpha/Beta hydrolase protein [Achaetomium macrosporum]|uniref:Carboxylic ester hydrolase n=1 Tax=Achaetomium macrosporum TaxID=79813 RepID=A0AAN7C2A5_9PEZI|nr:Alpha/Beta hydrolase protein [Achaetomium macrosporum]
MELLLYLVSCALLCVGAANANPHVRVVDEKNGVTYGGLIKRNGIEVFLGIPYGEDTGGENRFKPPKRRIPVRGSTINATSYGPSCPQELGEWAPPISLGNITDISEDCLNLNVARPRGTRATDRLPVMVYIHGGSFIAGDNHDPSILPDGMILESVRNGLPIVHVALNYRLGVFGFAQSAALKSEGSENAGLRDQRLGIEWVRDNIEQFGGDPERITIFGQSSGGLAVGMQIMAYGASKPVPFQQGICQSQALEPGITGNFTIDAMQAVVDYVDCDAKDLHSKETVACLRDLDMQTLLNASLATYSSDIAHNIGDIWLPVVDGDFLPTAPSTLIRQGRFANVTTMIGWCQNDVTFFTDPTIETPEDTRKFISSYVPDLTSSNVDKLLSLYPVSDFVAEATSTLSSEFFRAARIFRDILMTCQPIWYGQHIAKAGNDAYLYDWNQTILEPIIDQATGRTGWGPVHTSEFAYIFGNLSHYNISGQPFHPTRADYSLAERGSRSWSTFAVTGRPSLRGHDTFQGFNQAFPAGGHDMYVFVAGGPSEGLSVIDGPHSKGPLPSQKLRERCAFINSPEVIDQLRY